MSPTSLTNESWFQQAVHHLHVNLNLSEWIRDKSTTTEESDLTHHLLDFDQSAQNIDDQQKIILKSIQYSHSREACENGLISIYAHYTILNILRVWCNDGSSLFPLEKFGDCTFVVTLLCLLDYHYNYTRLRTDENLDRMSLLIDSILKVEANALLKHQTTINEILPQKAPLLYRLQKCTIVKSIQILSNPSLLSCNYGDLSMIRQPNINFILKLVNQFVKLIKDKSASQQHEVDFLLPIFFPVPLINLLFDLFLISPVHQTKIIILHLFSA